MHKPVRVAAPSAPAVTVADLKEHTVISWTDDDVLLGIQLQAAIEHIDGWSGVLGRCLVNQEWRVSLCDWPSRRVIRLPFPDVSQATVTYFDTDNVEQTVSASLVEVLEDERGSYVRFRDGFNSPAVFDDRSDGVSVTFTAGFGTAADVPESIKIAIMMLCAHWYEHRSAIGMEPGFAMPLGFNALIAPYRRVGL